MSRKFFTLFLIGAFLLATSLPGEVFAQTQTGKSVENQFLKTGEQPANTGLKESISKTTSRDASQTDFKKIEKENLNAKGKSKWSSGQKTALYLGIAAAVVIIIIVIASSGKDDGVETGFAHAGCPGNPLCQ